MSNNALPEGMFSVHADTVSTQPGGVYVAVTVSTQPGGVYAAVTVSTQPGGVYAVVILWLGVLLVRQIGMKCLRTYFNLTDTSANSDCIHPRSHSLSKL